MTGMKSGRCLGGPAKASHLSLSVAGDMPIVSACSHDDGKDGRSRGHSQRGLPFALVSINLRFVMTYEDRILDALGDPTRRRVFKSVRRGARSVGEIAEGMDVSRPAVSQHLKVLKIAQLVTHRAEGTRRLYTVDTNGIKALRTWLDGF